MIIMDEEHQEEIARLQNEMREMQAKMLAEKDREVARLEGNVKEL